MFLNTNCTINTKKFFLIIDLHNITFLPLNPFQFAADVMACNVNNITGMVELLDTWNTVDMPRGNMVDTVNDGFLTSAIVENGIITCT